MKSLHLTACGTIAAALLSLVLLVSGCQRDSAPPEPLRFMALGTTVEIRITDAGQADAAAALGAARAEIDAVHEAWHPRYGSELGMLNERLARGESMQISDELRHLLTRARQVEEASAGRFSPAIGGLTELWAFSSHDGPLQQPPDAEKLSRWVEQAPRLTDLHIDADNRVRSENDAVRLDLGGIGKGYAAGRAVAALAEHGVRAGMVHIGGDLATLGLPEPGRDRPWRIGVRDPRSDGILATVTAEANQAVFTSGDYERAFKHDGRLYHHILDPTTGYPAMGSRSVTVIDSDPVLADAAATALFIAGPQAWHTVAKQLGVGYVLLIDRHGEVWMTTAMAERVELRYEPPALHIAD
ncbi:hypothetical protein CKO15_08180 [Halorhodospira abdelmalekii]|uniref:FAD:protein FMN transferase n=1 Tax=Halorhodospira abdelmalekii TaxID=421629 RepID=UPI0019034A65|nr:FAD:protein FMN transferase [Halorhodospira abdelmalekii]MBK1735263.1 hypothetical protein [Halorhodospira abdelmalekii]